MGRFLFIGGLFLCFFACYNSDSATIRVVELEREMFDNSIQRSFYSRGIGWQSIPDSISVMYYPGSGIVEVQIKGQDVALSPGDSFRIGIIHPIRPLFPDTSQAMPVLPDLLLLSALGQDSLPLSFMDSSVGVISRQTYFRVGRRYYHLSSVDSSRSQIQIQSLPTGHKRATVAAIDLRFKSVPVKTLSQQNHNIGHQKGKALLLYFWSLGPQKGEDLRQLDSLYRQLPADYPLEIVAINRGDQVANLLRFQEEAQLQIPLYTSTPASCEGLHCSASLPHAMLVNDKGRIEQYHTKALDLLKKMLDE